MKIYLSGSTSTLGKILVSEFTSKGLHIKPIAAHNQSQWRLGTPLLGAETESFLIHMAHDRSMTLEETEIKHRQLIEAFAGRVIFVSSLSAFPQTLSRYGRQKLLIEDLVLDANGTVIKSGVMVGSELNGFTTKLKPLRLFGRNFQFSLRSNRDFFWITPYGMLVEAIHNLMNSPLKGTYGIYRYLPVSFNNLVKITNDNEEISFINLPDLIPVKMLELLSEIEHLSFLDSLLSLKRACPIELISEWHSNSISNNIISNDK